MNSLKIKKNDKVVVLSGKDRGKTGKVLGTRVAFKIADGKKTRVCKHCGAEL